MNDDWRLRIDVHEDGLVRALTERLQAAELEHQLETAFHDRVIVSVDGSEVFCYTGSRRQAEEVQRLVTSLAAEHGWELDFELRHWHPVAEDWEDPETPLPSTDDERAAERQELIERERAESEAQGYPDFEVRVQCQSAASGAELADRLRAEGIPILQRSNFLLVGAPDEDSAASLAQRIRGEAPAGCEVVAEASLRAVMDAAPANPFAVYGGLGG